MATFREKFQEFLVGQGVASVFSNTSVTHYEEMMAAQEKGLNRSQKYEAELIADEFFDNADEMIFREGCFPVIKIENIIEVKHVTCRAHQNVAQYAGTMIAHRLGRMNIGNDYEVSAAYVATYDGDNQISERYYGNEAVDQYRVTVEVELF